MGVVAGVGYLQHGRTLATGEQLEGQTHLLPQTAPGHDQAGRQWRDGLAQPGQLPVASPFEFPFIDELLRESR